MPVNFRLAAEEVAFLVTDSGAVAIVVDDERRDVGRAASGSLSGLAVTVRVGHDLGDLEDGDHSYDALAATGSGLFTPVDSSERDPALIMYTSGTTGHPEGAVLSYRNMAVQTTTLTREWQLFDDDDALLCATPLFQIAAIGTIAPLLATGCRTVIMPSGAFDACGLIEEIARERITHLFLVPAQWQAVVEEPDVDRASTLRLMCWGAAPASVTLLEKMAAAFPRAANVASFGQTEMSPTTCILRGADAARKVGSIGRPVPANAVRIVDEDMNDVPRGEVGEIVYRGANVMVGYWDHPEATREAFAGGWFHSGDLVREDEDGFLYVVDRRRT
ncbi:AMP-binding protein [Actinomycetospora sp. TBRC 11914]|nr:AMP-binding protein [Actinomycetospora sp. TBRC 11914]